LSNHTFTELNELFTDQLLSDRTAQKKLMHLLTKVCQKQTFAEGFDACTDQGLSEADLRRIGGVHGWRSVRLWSVRSDLQVKFGWRTCVNMHSSLQQFVYSCNDLLSWMGCIHKYRHQELRRQLTKVVKSRPSSQKDLMRVLTDVCQEQTFAEGLGV